MNITRTRSIDSIIASVPAATSSLSRGAGPSGYDDLIAKIQANDGEWRTSMLALTASLVKKGLQPKDILALAPLFTASGYSPHDTRAEMESMVDGAVRKYAPDKVASYDEETELIDAEHWHLDLAPPDYVLKGLITVGSLWAVIAPPKATKSFLTIHLALSVAMGTDWFGLSVKQGGVLLICGERGAVQRKRGAALLKHWGITSKPPITSFSRPLALYKDAEDFSRVMEAVHKTKERFGSCRMIVIDTLATVNGGADDVRDMPAMIAPLVRLREALPETAVVVVHHSSTSNATKARGRSDFLGAIDGQLVVQNACNLSTVKLGAANDVSIPFDHSYSIEDQEVGVDDDGETIKVGYLQPIESSPVDDADRIYGSRVIDRLKLILRAHSQGNPAPLTEDQWIDAGLLLKASPASTPEYQKRAIKRAMGNAIKNDPDCEVVGNGYRWSDLVKPIPSAIAAVFQPPIIVFRPPDTSPDSEILPSEPNATDSADSTS